MFIQTISTPKNDALKFIPGVEAMTDGSAEIHDTRAALLTPRLPWPRHTSSLLWFRFRHRYL